MKFDADGYFHCGQCNKHVIDLTAKSNAEIKSIISEPTFDSCANYLTEYHDGFWGTVQQTIARARQYVLSGPVLSWRTIFVPLVVVVFFISGCRTRGGSPVMNPPPPTKKEKHG